MNVIVEKPHVRAFHCIQEVAPGLHCHGAVVPTKLDGRFYTHRGIQINLPSSIEIPRCVLCKADYVNEELMRVLTDVLDIEYKRHEHLYAITIERLRAHPNNRVNYVPVPAAWMWIE